MTVVLDAPALSAVNWCEALAPELSCPVLTANRAWSGMETGLDIRLIR